MKMAKRSSEDVLKVIRFFQFIEEFMEHGTHTENAGEEDEKTVELTDEDFVEGLRKRWGGRFKPAAVDCHWMPIVYGYQALVENLCDPNQDVLALKPEIEKQLAEPEGLEEVLDGLRGNREAFREILTDKAGLLSRICANAAIRAETEGAPIWSVVSQWTGHGSGVSSAIYALYGPNEVVKEG